MIHLIPGLCLLQPQGQDHIGWSSQLPIAASTFTASHDALYYFVYYICVFFFLLITSVLVYSVIKYRRRYEGQPPASMVTHNTPLEVTWTVVPLIIVMIIFAWGFKGALDMSKAPANALTYQVTAERWQWSILHPPGEGFLDTKTAEFYVPVNTPVMMTTRSKDVLHSFYIPAFRVKRDVLPGRYQTVWFEANRLGTYDFFCTEYCGQQHSAMLGKVHVVSQEEFALMPWRQLPDNAVDRGEYFYVANCQVCHSTDGTPRIGPSFKDLYGREEEVFDQTTKKYVTIKIDDAYILESIRKPETKKVKGFELFDMTAFDEDSLPKKYVADLIAYMKTLSKHK